MTPQEAAAYYAEKAISAYREDGSKYSGAFFVGYTASVYQNIDHIEYFKLILKEAPSSIKGILSLTGFSFFDRLDKETKEWLDKMSLLI